MAYLSKEELARQNSLNGVGKSTVSYDDLVSDQPKKTVSYDDLVSSPKSRVSFDDLPSEAPSEVKKPSFEINAPKLIAGKLKQAAFNKSADFGLGGGIAAGSRTITEDISPEKKAQFGRAPSAFLAGAAQGSMGIAESVWRTPEVLGRGINYLGDTLSMITGSDKPSKIVKSLNAFDPETGIITRGATILGQEFSGTSDAADTIRASVELLPRLSESFKRNADLGEQANQAFQDIVSKKDPSKMIEVLSNPESWSAFIGQAAPSLALAYKSGGAIGFTMALEALDQANNAAEYEKRMTEKTGKKFKVSNTDYAKAVLQTAIINGVLEGAGVQSIIRLFKKSPAKKVAQSSLMRGLDLASAPVVEGTTEGLQEINTNVASISYDTSKDWDAVFEGFVQSVIGGAGAGGAAAAISAIPSTPESPKQTVTYEDLTSKSELPKDVKPESKQIATEEELAAKYGPKADKKEEPVKTEAVIEAEKVGKVVGIDAETKLPIIDTKQEAEKPKEEVPNLQQEATQSEEPSNTDDVPVQVVKPKRKRVYNEERAAERGDRATLIKVFGGWSDANMKTSGEQSKADFAKLLQYRRKGAQGIDALLDELKGQYPALFDKYSTGEDLRSAILNGTINEGVRSKDYEKQIEREIERAEAEQERLHAQAASQLISESDIEENVRQAETDLDPEQEVGDASFEFGENATESQPATEAEPTQEARQPDQAELIRKEISRYEDEGDITVSDLVDNIEAIDHGIKAIDDAVAKYREEQEYDRDLKGRGDMDAASDEFIASVKSAIESKPAEVNQDAEKFVKDSLKYREAEIKKLAKKAAQAREQGKEEIAQILEGMVRDYQSIDAQEFADDVLANHDYYLKSNIDPFLRFKNRETNRQSRAKDENIGGDEMMLADKYELDGKTYELWEGNGISVVKELKPDGSILSVHRYSDKERAFAVFNKDRIKQAYEDLSPSQKNDQQAEDSKKPNQIGDTRKIMREEMTLADKYAVDNVTYELWENDKGEVAVRVFDEDGKQTVSLSKYKDAKDGRAKFEKAREIEKKSSSLTLEFGGKEYLVSSEEQAVAMWEKVRDQAMKSGLSSRDMVYVPNIRDSKGNVVATITWNGSVNPTAEFKLESDQAPKPKTEEQTLIPGTEKPTYRKAKFGEKRELPDQKTEATELQAKANEEKQELLTLGDVQSNDGDISKIDDVGDKIGGARKDTAKKLGAKAKKANPDQPGWKNRYFVAETVSEGPDKGKFNIYDKRQLDYLKQPKRVGKAIATREEAEAMIPLVEVSRNHRVYAVEGGKFEIWRDVSDRKRVKVLSEQFDSREDAMKYMVKNAEKIIETRTSFGEEILPKPETVRRKGADVRQGRDVTAEDFRSEYGFRAVEFGLWNNQEERQEVMNHAYDALADMAEIIGIPHKAIGLDGSLALAFGARGQGLQGARAHYERSYGVINLTKMQGAGSLAHEWFHATDHYFARQDTKAKGRKPDAVPGQPIYDASSSPANDYASHGFLVKGKIRQELRDAYEKLIKTMFQKAIQYKEDTQQADKFVAETRKDLERRLSEIRNGLSQQLDARYYKRNNAPASAKHLAKFDEIAKKLLNGENLETKFTPIEGSRSRFAGRWTNEALEALSKIYKDVRGRSGFSSTSEGLFDNLRGYMMRYEKRLKLLAEAQSGTEKTKQTATSFLMESKSIDQGRSSEYWTSNHEMAARAFEAYIEDKVAEKGNTSDFLAFGTNFIVETPWGNKRPYPEGEERKAINQAFDDLFSVIKVDETGGRMFEPGVSYQAAPAFYSAVEKTVKEKMPNSATPEQIKGLLNNAPGVKQEELIAIELDKFLEGKAKVSKQELLDFLKNNGVKFDFYNAVGESGKRTKLDVELDLERLGYRMVDDMDGSAFIEKIGSQEEIEFDELPQNIQDLAKEYDSATQSDQASRKFEKWTVPGYIEGSYSEDFVTAPDVKTLKNKIQIEEGTTLYGAKTVYRAASFSPQGNFEGYVSGDYPTREGAQKAADKFIAEYYEGKQQTVKTKWKDGHSEYDRIDNPVVRIRSNMRLLPDGRKMFFIEEIQPPSETNQQNMPSWAVKYWREIGVKRAIQLALDKGADVIGSITGDMTADRYDLSKQIERITHSKNGDGTYNVHVVDKIQRDVYDRMNLSVSDLENLVGKEVAQKIVNRDGEVKEGSDRSYFTKRGKAVGTVQKNGSWYIKWEDGSESGTYVSESDAKREGEQITRDYVTAPAENSPRVLSGLDIKVGGEGLRKLYDQDIPNLLNKLTKKWGGRVGEISISERVEARNYNGPEYTLAQLEEAHGKVIEDENLRSSPLTGKKFIYGHNDIQRNLEEIIASMHRGASFKTSVDLYGNDFTADFMGGNREITTKQVKVRVLEITPAMRESIQTQGQAMFEQSKEYLANQAAEGYDKLGQEGNKAYGSKENYKRIQSKNLEDVRGNKGGVWRPSQAIRAIYDSLRKRGFAPLIGQTAETAQDIAEIASVFRNPRNEIFQAILVKEGKVVAHHAITQNIPSEVGNAYEFSVQMKEKMRQTGADSIYIAHNHPSGDPSPSGEDRRLTRSIERQFGEEYAGHLILNGNEFVVIARGGSEFRSDYAKPKEDYSLKSKSFVSAREMADYARLNFKENKLSLIFLNSQNQVLAIEYVRPEVKIGETLANKVNGHMAARYVVVTADKAMADSINDQRLPENIFDIIVLNQSGYESYNINKKLVTDGRTRFNSFLGSKADTALFSQDYAFDQKTTKVSESKMEYTGGSQDKISAQSDLKEGAEKYYQDFVNRFASIENAAQDALRSGAVMLPGKNPALLARSYLGVVGKVQAMLDKGVFKINANGKIEVLGSGLKEAIETFDKESPERDSVKRQEDLNKYLIARRTIEDLQRPAQGAEENIVSPEQVAESKKDISELTQKYGNLGLFFQTANKIYDFQRKALSLLVDAGVMDNQTYAKILALNPNYVPFDRIMDDENSSFMPKGKDRFTKARSPIRKIKGSEREIHDVLESIIKNTFKIVDTAERNKVARSIADLKDVLSDRIKPLKIKMMPIQLTENEAGGEETTIFRPSQFMPKGRTIEYFVDGKRKYMEVSQNLYEAMTGLNETGLGIMSKVLSVPANILRVGATITPEFISRNLIRDQLTAFMQTRFGYVPFIDAAGAVADILKKKDIYYDWLRSGGSYSGFIELSRKEMGKKVNELRNNPSILKKLNIVTSLQDLSQLIEQSSRVGVYKSAKKTGISDLEAGFESREGTLDFARRGAKTKDVNAVIAFFNAGVQGIDKSIRAAKADPVGFTLKGIAAITIPQIIFYLLNRDDDEYKEVPQWQKDLFFVFRLPGMEEFIRIPKPFLYGQVFGSFVERALTAIDKKDPTAFDGFAKVLLESAMPVQGDPAVGLIPTALKPIIENVANYNFFLGRSIVPEWRKGLPRWQQYDNKTSETAKLAGKGLNVSPSMIENLISGYLGGSGRYLLQVGDLLITKGGSASFSEPQDIPISKGFVTQKAYVSSQSVNDFYDSADRIEGAYLGYRQARKEGNQKDADKILKENPDMRLYSGMNKAKKLMSELNSVMYSETSKERKKWAGERRIDLAKRMNALIEKAFLNND